METVKQVTNVEELLDYILEQGFSIIEAEDNYFTVQCPRDASVTVMYEKGNDIEDIIAETITRFEDFDADEQFMELWSVDFAEHNHFKPSQFIRMLQEDEASLKELAGELRGLKD
jgi:hypothetical protein